MILVTKHFAAAFSGKSVQDRLFISELSQAQEAMVESRRGTHDIALVDIRLPDMDGLRLLRLLKRDNPIIKEIILTG